MLLPATASTVWILAIVSLLCLGSWAATLKMAGKWRFEFFYFDFVSGILLSAIAAAFVLGSSHPRELTFQDNLTLAGYRKMAWALGSGVVLNLGLLLLLAAMTVSGLSVAFPLALGVGLVIGTAWDALSSTPSSWVMVAGGIALYLAAVVSIALAHSWRLDSQRLSAQTPLRPDPRVKSARPKQPGAALAVALAFVSGIALSIFPRVVSEATSGENGLAPYSAVLLLSISALLSSPFFVLFFITFPITADAAIGGNYLSGNVKQHLLGIAGGLLWTAGTLCALLAAGAPSAAQPNPLIQYALSHAALLVAAAWGLLAWNEFRGANDRVRMMVTGSLVLFLSGLGLMAFAVSAGK